MQVSICPPATFSSYFSAFKHYIITNCCSNIYSRSKALFSVMITAGQMILNHPGRNYVSHAPEVHKTVVTSMYY